ncbi:MAG: SDR family oxidoreductase [Lentisphaerae bacterium]|nr:SDR family oxidoreductase [Lentisphaerota bacterium]
MNCCNTSEHAVVILTGAGGGIGRAIAVKLASAGMKLVLLGGNNLEKLEITRQEVEKFSSCLVLPGDLTDTAFLADGVRKAHQHFGAIDVVINNAGVAQNTAFENVSIEEYDRIMAINARAPFFLIRNALPFLKSSDRATIINIASVVAHAGYPQQSVYTASKHALLGFTRSIAREYYRDNIRVHAICPGGVYTDMVKISRPDLTPEGMIMPEEIADIVYFFLANRGNAVIDEICVHRVNKEPFLI